MSRYACPECYASVPAPKPTSKADGRCRPCRNRITQQRKRDREQQQQDAPRQQRS